MTQEADVPAPRPHGPSRREPELPPTVEEFNALAPAERTKLARQMTRTQRDRLLGRPRQPDQPGRYL